MTRILARPPNRIAGTIGRTIQLQGRDNSPDTVKIRIRKNTHDDDTRPVHLYSRGKTGTRAENLRTLGFVRDVMGGHSGQTSLRCFEASLCARARKGDKPLTTRQFPQAGNEAIMNPGTHAATNVGLDERPAYFPERTGIPLTRQGMTDALAAPDETRDSAARERLDDLLAELERNDADPIGLRTFENGIIDMFSAATHLVRRLPDDNSDKTRLLLSLERSLADTIGEMERVAPTPGSEAARIVRDDARQAIGRILRQLWGMTLDGDTKPLTRNDVQRLSREASVGRLNRGGRWEPVVKPVVAFPGNESPVIVTSGITPAGHTDARFAVDYRDADGRVTGVSSNDTGNARHAVNLARTTLNNAVGKTIFHAVRHGVCSAFGIDDKAERQTANRTRAQEVLTLVAQDAIRANPGLLDQAREDSLELPLVSLSLLTPDFTRRGSDNEAQFLREQNAAWQSLDAEPPAITVDVPGRETPVTLRIRPRLATFNFPDNEMPRGNAVKQRLLRGYFTSGSQNRQAFNALLGTNFMKTGNPADLGGIAGACVRELEGRLEARQIRELAGQCRALWQNDGRRDSGEAPCQLPARLAVLTSLLGFPAAFSCKSGKDRASQMDVEAKTIAAFIDRYHRIPGLDGLDDTTLRRIRAPMALGGGNHEMQIRNTGFARFKSPNTRGPEGAFGENMMTRVIGFAKLVRN
jgi:hypothetical protein